MRANLLSDRDPNAGEGGGGKQLIAPGYEEDGRGRGKESPFWLIEFEHSLLARPE